MNYRTRSRSAPQEIEATDFDEHLIRPTSGWQGSRGASPTFGGDDPRDWENLPGRTPFEKFVSYVEVDSAMKRRGSGGSQYGRLYRSRGDHRLSRASSADRDVLIGRSGSSGYRGGRPFFGRDEELEQVFGADHETELRMGPLEYKGPQLGGIALGLAAMLLAWKVGSR